MNPESPIKFLIAAQTQTTITNPLVLASMIFSTSDFTME
jgi:hypothetical protein